MYEGGTQACRRHVSLSITGNMAIISHSEAVTSSEKFDVYVRGASSTACDAAYRP